MRRVLIANRGEIAVRVIRACREMGLESVAVFSDADTESLHVKLADRAVRIGTGPAANSYLRIDRILEAAARTQADAVHPGYGLLSENPVFAQAIQDAGLVFIGPTAEAMRQMGSKTTARALMKKAGVPIIPGTQEPIGSFDEAKKIAAKIGFPVLIKAVSGGGGRGMRMVEGPEKLVDAYESAAREALGAFGDGRLYMERYLRNPRHVEIQILADNQGNCVYVGERECSIQRRHQKIIEECPCVFLSEKMRAEMGKCAVKAATAVHYRGAGTVEFLVDGEKDFYFIEMNTRIQVEHPVTELVYGLDLVNQQLKIAMGESLPFSQKDLVAKGAAIECRVCAEDPDENYRPCPGEIAGLRFPGGPGVRIDSSIYVGYKIPIYYDPMICKLITWGEDRATAISRMQGALREFQIHGVKTNISQLRKILDCDEFRHGQYDIRFVEHKMSGPLPLDRGAKAPLAEVAAIAAAISQFQKRQSGVQSPGDAKRTKRNLSSWKLPTQSWKLTGLRRMMDRGV